MKDQKRKIAIITNRILITDYNDYEDTTQKIIDSITEWEEVTEAEFQDLLRASSKMGFTVMEQPRLPSEFIAKTIADFKKIVAAQKKKEEAAEKERKAKALARKQKKEAKTKQEKRELLAKLQAELRQE